MSRRFRPIPLLLSVAIACETPPAAPTIAGTLPAPHFEVGGAPASATTVEIKSEHLTGVLPIGLPVVVRLKVIVQGTDPSSLSGEGRHFASTGAHNYWPATGSLDGTVATVSGSVTESNAPYLVGSPVEVVADASTGTITLRFGPLSGGPFAHQTLEFTGTGDVSIR